MSVLNKVPYISALIGSMSAEELTTLTNLMNGSGNRAPLRRTVNPIDDASCPHITSEDKGVHMCSLTCNYTNFTGYLVYTDDYCALLSFTDSIVLKVFDIDVTNVGIRTIDEAITVLELRSVVWQEIHKNDGESGTVVVANPELVGTEDALTGLEVGNTKYKVPQPTTVEANPELAGTEDALTGLKVGSTKYKIAGGTKLYRHFIEWVFEGISLGGETITKIDMEVVSTNSNNASIAERNMYDIINTKKVSLKSLTLKYTGSGGRPYTFIVSSPTGCDTTYGGDGTVVSLLGILLEELGTLSAGSVIKLTYVSATSYTDTVTEL